MGTLELEGMEFHACHGCAPHEKLSVHLFIVDFRAETDMSAAAASDRLEDTVDYGGIYDTVADVMNGKHADLLEYLAGEIIRRISERFPGIPDFSIRVSKYRPPVNGVASWSRVTLRHSDIFSK